MANGIFGREGGLFSPERAQGLAALGLGLSQLGAGQQVNLSQPLAALQKRQQDAKTREQLEGLSSRFTPDQQAILAAMPPNLAMQVIAQEGFRAPASPIEVNNQLIDPNTFAVIGDFRTPEAPPALTALQQRAIDGGLTQGSPEFQKFMLRGGSEAKVPVYQINGQQLNSINGVTPGTPGAAEPGQTFNVDNGKISPVGGGGVEVNLPGQPQVGTIPTGQQLIKDPTTGAFRLENIPGGALDQAAAAAAAAAETGAGLGEIKRSVVDDQIDTALGLMEQKGVLDLPEAGIIGSALGRMSLNQEAVDLKNTLAGIQATVAFDTLQKMREASKSGGALGSVSERELDLLISAYGALQQSTSPALLRTNLNTVKRVMGKIANDPVASQFISRDNPAAGGAGEFVIRGRVD